MTFDATVILIAFLAGLGAGVIFASMGYLWLTDRWPHGR